MNNLHYKFLKLSNGENIVCATDDDCQNLKSKISIHILDPVLVTPVRIPRGSQIAETYVLTPWISISDETVYEIPTQQIIVATDVKEHFRDNYKSFIEHTNEPKPIKDNGSLEEEFLSNLMKSMKNDEETNEESEGDKRILVAGNRSVH